MGLFGDERSAKGPVRGEKTKLTASPMMTVLSSMHDSIFGNHQIPQTEGFSIA